MKKTCIAIVHYGDPKNTKNTLDNLKKKLEDERVILVNNTDNDISSLVKIIKNTSIVENKENLGFSKAVNQAITLAQSFDDVDSIFLLNNDAQFTFGNLNMLRNTLFQDDDIGIVTPVLHHSDDQYDWGARLNKFTGNVSHLNFPNKPKKPLTPQHVSGAAMLIRMDTIDKVGMFDEKFFMYFEDVDYCMRVNEAGISIIIDPEIVVKHKISSSSSELTRLFTQWQSHIKFIFKYMPTKVYPTALIYDGIFYTFAIYKSLLRKLLTR